MRAEREENRAQELIALLGELDFVRLVEAYGGTRLYVSATDQDDLRAAFGRDMATKLSARHAGTYIRVPLARELRARHYRLRGHSNSEIARKLGINETSVDKIFSKMVDKPVKGSGDPRQLKLFAN